jgi:hypothetical protein
MSVITGEGLANQRSFRDRGGIVTDAGDPIEIWLAGARTLDEVGDDRKVLLRIGGAYPTGILVGTPEEGKEFAQRQLFRHLDT